MANRDKKVKTINRNELMQIISIDTSVKLADASKYFDYGREHIKGAISLPPIDVLKRAKRLLKKNDTIITYCDNVQRHASTTVAKLLLALGYKNVLDYKDGLTDYKKANLPLEGCLYSSK